MATFPLRNRQKVRQRRPKRELRLVLSAPEPPLIDSVSQFGTRYLTVMQLVNRDGESCYLCADPLKPGAFEIDHIIPKSRGGSNHPLNLALACKTCNTRKRDLIVAFDIADRRPVFRLP